MKKNDKPIGLYLKQTPFYEFWTGHNSKGVVVHQVLIDTKIGYKRIWVTVKYSDIQFYP